MNSRLPVGDATLLLELRELWDVLRMEVLFDFDESPIMGVRRTVGGEADRAEELDGVTGAMKEGGGRARN